MIELIPAIDIIDGKCVRLVQGDYQQKTIYNEDPLEVAKAFQDSGIKRLHVVDLDGAKAHHIVNYKVLDRITSHTSLVVDFGGGLKSSADADIAFECGAQMITGGSIAVKDPDTFLGWIEKYGSDCVILGADVKDEKIAVSGWTEESDLSLIPFVEKYLKKGIHQVITTDIRYDGTLQGPSCSLYSRMLEKLPGMYLIASGGVSSMADLERLEELGVPAVIFGKAIYEGRIKLKDLRHFL